MATTYTPYTAETYPYDIPFDNSKGKDVFREIEKAPEIEDVDEEFKEQWCYKKDTTLRGANIDYPYTEAQILEIDKCSKDIFYFIQNYVSILTLEGGLQLFEPFQYQKNMLKMMDENRFTIFTTSRQAGKCVHPSTMITVKNKITNEIERISIGDFYERVVATYNQPSE